MKTRRLIFGFLLILALACGSGSQRPAEKPVVEKPAAPAAGLGQEVSVGEVRWKVLEARDLGKELKSDNEFIEPRKTGGKFVLVRLEVENRKSEAATYAGISLVDDRGRKFEHYSEQFGFIPDSESCVLQQINPSLTKICSEIFEIPADARGIKALLGDLEMFGGEEVQVSLGF